MFTDLRKAYELINIDIDRKIAPIVEKMKEMKQGTFTHDNMFIDFDESYISIDFPDYWADSIIEYGNYAEAVKSCIWHYLKGDEY